MAYTYLFNAQLINGTGGPPIPDAAVLIDDDRIVAAGHAADVTVPKDVVHRIDAGGGTILPGIIDCHAHITTEVFPFGGYFEPYTYRVLKTARYGKATLSAGVTTIRDAGGADRGIQQAFDEGVIPGPRTKISVTMLSITGGHGDEYSPWVGRPLVSPLDVDGVCDGIDEVRKKVREVIRAGAQVIKVATTGGVISPTDSPEDAHFSPDELKTIVEEARMHGGIRAMAHAQGAAGIKNAVRAGFLSIEHGIYLDQEAIDLMLEHDTYLVPTLVAPRAVLKAREEGLSVPDFAIEKTKRVLEAHADSIGRAYRAGVKIAFGTDSGVGHHGTNLEELALLGSIGMNPMEAIISATKTASELLGMNDRIGTIETGKLADLIISRTDPLSDMRSLAENDNIWLVMKGGALMKDLRSGRIGAPPSFHHR